MIGTPGTGGVAGRRWLVNAPQLKKKDEEEGSHLNIVRAVQRKTNFPG